MEKENRCSFCNRRNLSGYCLPFKKMVKGGSEVFGCKFFVCKKERSSTGQPKKGS